MLRDTLIILQLAGALAGCGCETYWVRKSAWFVVWYEPRRRCSYDTCPSPVPGILGMVFGGFIFLSLMVFIVSKVKHKRKQALLDEESDDDEGEEMEWELEGGKKKKRPIIKLNSKLQYSTDVPAAR